MKWLVVQTWLLLLISFLAGALLTWLFLVRLRQQRAVTEHVIGDGADLDTPVLGFEAPMLAPYPGAVLPLADGSAPSPGHTIKGDTDSMLYHAPDSPSYASSRAQVWFRTEDDAQDAGFRPWNWLTRTTTVVAPTNGAEPAEAADTATTGGAEAARVAYAAEAARAVDAVDAADSAVAVEVAEPADAVETLEDLEAVEASEAAVATEATGTEDAAPTSGVAQAFVRPEIDEEPTPTATAAIESPYGPGSAQPLPDGAAPSPDYVIKGNAGSMLFHTPESPYYRRTRADAWFRAEEDARRAGFAPWNRKIRQSARTVPVPAFEEGRYPGSARPASGGAAPTEEFIVKGHEGSMLYHTRRSPFYDVTEAEVWFRSEADAERAGFTAWSKAKATTV